MGVSLRDRAFVLRTAPKVAALWASIPNAVRSFTIWLGPFGVIILGMSLLMAGVSLDKPNIAISVAGGLMLFGAIEMHADRARGKEMARWAERIAMMLAGDDRYTTFKVEHTFQSLRPELDRLIDKKIASAIEAQRAETAQTDSVADESLQGVDRMTDFDRRYEVGFSEAKVEAVLILRSLLWGGMPDREALEGAIEAIAGMVLPASGDK